MQNVQIKRQATHRTRAARAPLARRSSVERIAVVFGDSIVFHFNMTLISKGYGSVDRAEVRKAAAELAAQIQPELTPDQQGRLAAFVLSRIEDRLTRGEIVRLRGLVAV